MRISKKLAIAVCVFAVSAMSAYAQSADGTDGQEEVFTVRQQKLNGPRMGMTYVVQHSKFDRDGTLKERLEEQDIGSVISQFGWHFEWVVAPEAGGPGFVTELIPFIGGVEYSTIMPSLSMVLGIRMPQGFEFGMGPNLLVTFDKNEPVSTTLVIAVGQSLKFDSVRVPLNLALSTNKSGNRISMIFGYAMPARRNSI